jgi:hypothetical protein
MRTCRECGEVKGSEHFYEYRPGKRRHKCRSCCCEVRQKWRRDNADRVRRADNNKHLLRKFGITLDEYERMAEMQGHVCAICGEGESVNHRGTKTSRLAVDHDHQTGAVRALLCFRCNTSLGHFENNGLLHKALAYVEEYRGI